MNIGGAAGTREGVMTAMLVLLALATASEGHAANGAVRAEPNGRSQAVELAELRSEIRALKDRQEIHDVYMRYMRGFDRNDIELMRGAFWPDAQINYGRQSNTFDEFVERHLKQHVATLETWGHLLTNESVEILGDLAYVESYVTRLSSSKDNSRSMIISGRYIDRLERRDGEWRVAVREFVPHFMTETDTALERYITSDWADSKCGMGTWDRRDPSYRRPFEKRKSKSVGPACAE